MKNILLIAGTRPNFIKLAPLYHRLREEAPEIRSFICHTGQHFDYNMSDIFWKNLELPQPDFQLNIKGTGVADTIGKTILGINEVIRKEEFSMVVVFGDVNATAAGAIVGAQSHIPVMHVEAGLRSFDRQMPEEINRIMTDHVSDYLMVSEPSGMQNLKNEGFSADKAKLVGNIMIECLVRTRKQWEQCVLPQALQDVYRQRPVIATFHRPENVDSPETLRRIVDILLYLASSQPILFPVHPRTAAKLSENGWMSELQANGNVFLSEPLGYFDFLKLVSNARLVITDSGGVQEETSFLNVPCITFRKNTERPVTQEIGTNLLMSIWDGEYALKIVQHIAYIGGRAPAVIPLWDEAVSRRIVQFIKGVI